MRRVDKKWVYCYSLQSKMEWLYSGEKESKKEEEEEVKEKEKGIRCTN